MNVELVWHKKNDKQEDDILSVYERPSCKEILQLRRSSTTEKNRIWYVRSCLMSDNEVDKIFGKNWYYETLRGFTTTAKFHHWLEENVDVN
jgi:hypothetical protein|tara:strand:+ start:1110 stop:1382 length:273 start_codon:yes stop_codon:yes gene_type:complete